MTSPAVRNTSAPPEPRPRAGDIDHVVLLRGMRWSDWIRLTESKGNARIPRMATLDGAIELMSPSRHHERLKSYLGCLVETWCLQKGIDIVPLGSWTLESRDNEAGLEPDECYQLGPVEKDRPDVAIEIVWTSGHLDKLEIYRRLGVPEVWFWRRGALTVHVLRDGAYETSPHSEAFPGIDLPHLLTLLTEPTVSAAQRALIAHLRGTG